MDILPPELHQLIFRYAVVEDDGTVARRLMTVSSSWYITARPLAHETISYIHNPIIPRTTQLLEALQSQPFSTKNISLFFDGFSGETSIRDARAASEILSHVAPTLRTLLIIVSSDNMAPIAETLHHTFGRTIFPVLKDARLSGCFPFYSSPLVDVSTSQGQNEDLEQDTANWNNKTNFPALTFLQLTSNPQSLNLILEPLLLAAPFPHLQHLHFIHMPPPDMQLVTAGIRRYRHSSAGNGNILYRPLPTSLKQVLVQPTPSHVRSHTDGTGGMLRDVTFNLAILLLRVIGGSIALRDDCDVDFKVIDEFIAIEGRGTLLAEWLRSLA
ncbi:hypothetical protein DL96DRAFT_1614578 [Flagelloscypha sp. PMI_526]|nr:hypothetical protein DL96DRAFT_1614578 [Flagelloscypha sp. PMI_526]